MSLQPLDPDTQKYFETRGTAAPEAAVKAAEPVLEPAPEPTPEPTAEPTAEPTDDNKGQFVRLGALHEERAKRREFERQLQEERAAREKLEARTNEILKRFQDDEPKAPEWEQDPLGHTKTRLETQEERLARLERENEQTRLTSEQHAAYAQFHNAVAQKTNEFLTKTPDYPQAYQHLITMQAKALEVAGFPPEQIRATLLQYEDAIAQKALQDGVNPAERAYAMAKQMGYRATQGPSAAEQKLQRITEGQRTSASLSDAGGTAKPQLDAKTLANMPDDEFAKIWSNRKQVRQIVTR